MKTIFIVVLLSLTLFCWGEEEESIKIYTLGRWLQIYRAYEQECYNDTIKANAYLEDDILWYIIPYEGSIIQEMVLEGELEDRGYKYRYRWVNDIDSLGIWDIEYIFTKELSIKGFAEFLRNKIEEEK